MAESLPRFRSQVIQHQGNLIAHIDGATKNYRVDY
jgi:hypothetical protein